MAGVVNVLATSPLWVVSSRLKVQQKTRSQLGAMKKDDSVAPEAGGVSGAAANVSAMTAAECVRQIVVDEGVWALWDGTKASIILASNPAIQFATYGYTKWLLEVVHKAEGAPLTGAE